MKAKELMTQDVATIRGSATVAEAVKLMKLKELRALVVEPRNENDAYGILTETDIAYKVAGYGKDPKQVRVYEIMTKPCIVVNPDLDVEYVARLFANTGIRRAPVIQGDLVGIISVSDIITKGDFVENPKLAILERELQKAVSNARSISASQGADSEEANEAWQFVADIEAEAALLSGETPVKSAIARFRDEQQPQPVAVG